VREVQDVERDGTTGLPDRATVLSRLDTLLAQGERPAVYMVAVEGYEALEARDVTGARDAMRAAAGRLDRLLRSSDVLGTAEPGTFVVLGAGVAPAVAGSLVERVQGALALPVEVDGEPLSLRVDVGIAFATPDSSAHGLLEQAGSDLDRARRR
jgi:GGDEF domain-containing protein